MIEYHGDGLVPAELCRLLCQAVPRREHVPVRFFNRHDAYGKPSRGRPKGYSTPFGIFMRGKRPWVGVNLNAVFFAAAGHLYPRLAPSTAVWRALLDVCLHEFGHAATRGAAEGMNRHEYNAEPWGRVYRLTERLADDWKDQCVARILEHDARLGQPRRITGYLGLRLAERRTQLGQWIDQPGDVRVNGAARATYVKEQRCWRAGAQLTCGDVLRELGLDARHFSNAYRVLRKASSGVGVGYTDGAGRRHKLYDWGDVPTLAQRLGKRVDQLVPRKTPPGGGIHDVPVDEREGDSRRDRPGPSEEAADWGYQDAPF